MLIGRTVSTKIVGLPSLIVMIYCGLAVGWRAGNGLGDAVAGFALLALFGFAMGWVGAVMGRAGTVGLVTSAPGDDDSA